MSKEYLVRVIRIKDLREMPLTSQRAWDELKQTIKPGIYLCNAKQTPSGLSYSVIYMLSKPVGTKNNINDYYAEIEEVDVETILEETEF